MNRKDFDNFEINDNVPSIEEDVDNVGDADSTADDVDGKKDVEYEIPGYTIHLNSEVAKKKEIVFKHRMNGEMQKNLPFNPDNWRWGHIDQLASAMTDWPLSSIRELETEDLAAVRTVVTHFLTRGLAIGGKDSE